MTSYYKALFGLLLMASTQLFADVNLTTSVNRVYYRGAAEFPGSIAMTVNHEDFAGAGIATPIYIRVRLTNNALLADTRVDLTETGGAVNRPIYLAMSLDTVATALEMRAPPETVSIVRWIAGETDIWLKVQTTSHVWIGTVGGNVLLGPCEDAVVSWQFGIGARLSAEIYPGPQFANLPFNTRNAATSGQSTDAASTVLCTDLSGSDVTLTGASSQLTFDIQAYDHQAAVNPGEYVGTAGNTLDIVFSDDRVIGHSLDRSCEVYVDQEAASSVLTDGDFLTSTNALNLTMDCMEGPMLPSRLNNAARLELWTPAEFDYGFFMDTGSAVQLNDVEPDTLGREPFVSHGRTLYRRVIVPWHFGERTLENFLLNVSATLTWHPDEQHFPSLYLEYAVYLANHDNPSDQEPFTGLDHNRRCRPSHFPIIFGEWDNPLPVSRGKREKGGRP
ncbi:MAG: hypothetical protein QNK37_19950 [Acidobacteriota bacterium]|nr:hypothetical protein [Acidobacteriota bacterium]